MSPEPGWHADPFGRHQHRYWDGRAWTAHVTNNGVASVDSPMHRPGEPGAQVRLSTGAGPSDRQRAERLLEGLDAGIAQRNTDMLYEFGISLNTEGGISRDWRQMSSDQRSAFLLDRHRTNPTGETLQRPWLWLATVAEEAARNGDLAFAIRVVLAVWIWSVEFAPKMNAGAFFEGVVNAPTSSSLAAAYSIVYRALARDPANDRVRATAKHLAPVVVNELGEYVAPDVRAAAWMLAKS